MSLKDELKGYIDDQIREEIGYEEKPGYEITDESSANWCIDQLKQIKEEEERIESSCEESINDYTARVEAFKNTKLSPLKFRRQFLETALQEYVKKSEKRSVSLISGTVYFKKNAPKIEYDEEELIQSIERMNPQIQEALLNTKISINKKNLKDAVIVDLDNVPKIDGVSVPVTVENRDDSFVVRYR